MATGQEKIEVPAGAIDGVNSTFSTSVGYQPSTVVVWASVGLWSRDGFTLSPPDGVVFDEAPLPGDTVLVRYLPGL